MCAILREIEGCGHVVAHLARFAQQTKKKRETAGIYTRLCKLCKKKMNVPLSKEQRLYQHANVFVVMDCPANKEQIKIID